MQSLDGITVADFTQLMAGGWATQKLGDMGADVIKVEPPRGDTQRGMSYAGQYLDGAGIGFLAMNRNKRSVALDLKSDDGYEIARDIVASADVLVHNFRPRVMAKFDLDYESVREFNEDIVYTEVSAYGSDGPFADRPGQDLLFQAVTGLTSYTGRSDDPPTPAGTVVVDEHTATLAALHTLHALFHRERTGEGQKVETSLFNSAVDLQVNEVAFTTNTDQSLERGAKTHGHPYLWPPYGLYEAADGYVAIGMAPLDEVAEALDVDGLDGYESQTEMFEARDEIHDTLEAATAAMSAEAVVDRLVEIDCQADVVREPQEVVDHPQARHNDMIAEIEQPNGDSFTTTGIPARHSETPGRIDRDPPELGEHSADVLAELGYEDADIERLREDGVIE
jgi:crotonobetainyl-CoA:carnitine CoA-transferase CaiB-like acyl-CoA transferase